MRLREPKAVLVWLVLGLALVACQMPIEHVFQNPSSHYVKTIEIVEQEGVNPLTSTKDFLQLEAIVGPETAKNRNVNWSSSAPEVATVDSQGRVTAVAAGTATIFATAQDPSGVVGKLNVEVRFPKMYYLSQPTLVVNPATSFATYSSGAFSLRNGYTSSNNNFVYQATGNFYGKAANSFLTLPKTVTGDFTIQAKITNPTSGGAAGSGVGIGMTTGFTSSDKYAYTVLNNASGINMAYVNSATTVANVASTGTPTSYTANTPVEVVFKRVGTKLYFGTTTGTLAELDTSLCTDGTTVFGDGPVYPCLSFVRNGAAVTVTDLVITDASGKTLFDSTSGGALGTYVVAALSVSATTIDLGVGTTYQVAAVANAEGYDAPGAVGTVTATTTDGTGSVTASVLNDLTGSTVTITGIKAGTATVTVTSDAATGNKVKTIAVTVTEFPASDSAYAISPTALYPAPGATQAYTDGELAMTFDTAPTLESGGLIKIYRQADGVEVDSIAFSGETQKVPTSATTSVALNVQGQLVRIVGNTVYITPHFGKLQYGTAYYVSLPSTSVAGTFGGAPFEGLSSSKDVATWNFATRAAPTLDPANITVSNAVENNTADFRSLGGALMYLVQNPLSATNVTINVAAGTYTELVQYRPSTANLGQTFTIQGPTNNRGSDCIIQYVNGGGMNTAAQNLRASFYFAGANLVLQNLTIRNNGVRASVSQAEALYFDSRKGSTLVVNNCSLISRQDTVNTTGRNWFYNCYIEGNVDFIWGTADVALFENCALQVVYDGATNTASNPYSLIVARTPGLLENGTYTSDSANSATANMASFTGTVGKGYVVKGSSVTIGSPAIVTLGRNAGTGKYYDQVAVIDTTFTSDATNTGVLGSTGSHYLWSFATAPTKLGDSTRVGFKGAGNSGLNLATLTNDISASAASTIADQATEYATRDQILNRVVTVVSGAPTGYQASPLGNWDVSALASAFGAP